jgi:hypothetical protein
MMESSACTYGVHVSDRGALDACVWRLSMKTGSTKRYVRQPISSRFESPMRMTSFRLGITKMKRAGTNGTNGQGRI